jgi:DNA-binding transcriptional MerR regulator
LNTDAAKTPDGKLYYSISEVASMLGLEAYVLRFWEKEFTQLRPKKNRAGNRIYQQKDIELLLQVKHLLYDKGFTIDGARNFLKGEAKTTPAAVNSDHALALLKEIRAELDEMLAMIP